MRYASRARILTTRPTCGTSSRRWPAGGRPKRTCSRCGEGMRLAKYQLFPDLAPEEYEELKADIAARGVQVPIEYDEEKNILDGHHRKRICDELGITDF